MFKLGVINDEVSQNLDAALRFAQKHSLDALEIRSVEGKNPFQFEKSDILKIKDAARESDIKICGISSPFYKCNFGDKKAMQEHLEGLKRCIEWASILGANIIRGFDFWHDPSATLDRRVEMFALPAELIKDAGMVLALESDPAVNSSCCAKIASLVRAIDSPNVRALYDPGNDIYSDDLETPYPNGYKEIKDIFCHVHIKDAVRENGKTVATPVGKGEVDYSGLFRELAASYDGYVMLETHYKPNLTMDEELLKRPQGDAISYMGEIASEESIINLKKIIEKARSQVK